MPQPRQSPALGSLVLIAVVIGVGAAAFAYTAGWFSPHRLTPDKLVDALAPPAGPALGHRRNHAKGVCFTGQFEANGAGTALSRAQVFTRGEYPVVGRFNLGTPNPSAPDSTVRVRANEVRKRLAAHYDQAAPRAGIRIELPLGAYAPQFTTVAPAAAVRPTPGPPPMLLWQLAAPTLIAIT